MEFLAFFIGGLLGVGAGIVLKRKFLKKGYSRILSVAGAWCAGFLIFFVSAALCLSFIAPEPSYPTSTVQTPEIPQTVATGEDDLSEEIIKFNKTSILEVNKIGNGVLEIHLKAGGLGFSQAGYIDAAAYDARGILLKMLEKYPDLPFQLIRFVVIGEYTDQYNNNSKNRIFSMTYEYPELKKINNIKEVDARFLLNFAGFDYNRPDGFEMYKEWCEKGTNAERSRSFCNASDS